MKNYLLLFMEKLLCLYDEINYFIVQFSLQNVIGVNDYIIIDASIEIMSLDK